mgnify:CR=1 FL=1
MWSSRVLVWSLILCVYYTVAVEVKDYIVAWQFCLVTCVPCCTTDNVVPRAEVAVVDVSCYLTEGVTSVLLVIWLECWVIAELNFVDSVCHTCVEPCTDAVVEGLVQTNFQFVTTAVYNTEVGCWRAGTEV